MYNVQTWWLAFVTMGGGLVNAWQLWRWRHIHSELSISIKVMSALRMIIGVVVGAFYFLDAFAVLQQNTRENLFLSTLAPLYWPILLYGSIFMTSPRIDISAKLKSLKESAGAGQDER